MGRYHRRTVERALGDVVRSLRKSAGISQEALGLAAESGRTYISEIERGVKSPSVRVLFRLARVLQVKPSEIVRQAEALVQHD
jgi:transcriptional regulator with XRE-family HTH domain